MNDRKDKLKKELEHLDKAHRAGIIDNREFQKGRERIEGKLAEIETQEKQQKETSKAVSDILETEKEPAVEIVDIPEDNYGVVVEPSQELIKEIDYDESSREEPDTEDGSSEDEDMKKEDGKARDEEPADDGESQDEDRADEEEDGAKQLASSKPKARRLLLKRKKSKKTSQDTDFESEDAVSFSWRPLLAVLALIIVLASIYMLFRYTSGNSEAPPVEPMANVIQGSNISLAVEGITIPVEVYSDYRCGPCRMTREHIKDLKRAYGESLDIIYKNFPLDQNLNAAMAGECADEQSMFDAYADRLFQAPTSDAATLKNIAKELGLNQARFSACLDTESSRSKVIADYQEGVSKGVKGTPTVFINGRIMEGYHPYAELKEMVDFQLA